MRLAPELVVNTTYWGSSYFATDSEEVMICLVTVLKPMLAKSRAQMRSIAAEMIPPVVVRYSS